MHRSQITLPTDAHILIVKLAGIGDLLLATPAIAALRESYPEAQIDLLVTPDSAGILNGWDAITNTIILDKYLFDDPREIARHPEKLLSLRELWRKLRSNKYDAVLLLHHLTLRFGRLKHQMLTRASGATWRVGLDNGHGWFLNVHVQDHGFGAMHEAEYGLEIARAVGATATQKQLYIPLTEQERAEARTILFENGQETASRTPIIAIHPGSGGYSTARRWSPERFARLADTLYESFGGQLILMGGPEETMLHQEMISHMTSAMPVRSLAGRGSIKVAAAILEKADLFIGNDAGLMHLATAVKTPTVAIFGLSNDKAWGPYAGDATPQRAVVVKLDLPCMPCFYRGHELGTPEGCATRDCLGQLGIEPVAVAARAMLRNNVR